MALGERVAVMGVEGVDRRGARERRPRRAGAAPVEQEPGARPVRAELRDGEAARDVGQRRPAPARGDADEVEGSRLRLRDHGRGQVVEAEVMDEAERGRLGEGHLGEGHGASCSRGPERGESMERTVSGFMSRRVGSRTRARRTSS